MDDFFYGWYLKCQSDTQTLAVIPAVHQVGNRNTCSIQIITENEAWTFTFPGEIFFRTNRNIYIGENRFGKDGICLNVKTSQITVKGELFFGRLWPLQYPIMGPFSLLPFMECRHGVWSMLHSVSGKLLVNGKEYCFRNAGGYWEGDCGHSFPKNYAWTQCFFTGGSLMLSVADIPIGRVRFTGIIGVVLWQGREYRFATYLGAKVLYIKNKRISVMQGHLKLEAGLLKENGQPLKAPQRGDMARTIHESATCQAFYRFIKGKRTLFTFTTPRASFEYEYPL
ncbi:MAG: hypothetical protein IKK33_08840 [Lachnospiraceae bacterium]|nr:hypothetical protein [Lachnospiraceae bacterium]